jgi:magnesium transporter
MAPGERWIDLLDPTPQELHDRLPAKIHERALEQLLAPMRHDDEPRPKLESHGDYIFGVFLVSIAVREEDVVFYQEVDIVMTHDFLVTIRKTPAEGRPPYDPTEAQQACRDTERVGMIVYHLVDDMAERFLDLVDDVNDEIDELEEHVEEWTSERVRERISHLRHDLLQIRRTLAPTRDAIRAIVDNRIELDGEEVFPHEVELSFGAAYDKLMRATDGLDLSRDLVAGVRDYHQAKVANDQNEVMKRLTVTASLLLVPTFIVGLYGQNFVNMPELHWHYGYLGWSWGLIVVTTIMQLVFFKWKKWI